ncbi:MAG TPA: hypothetical protein VFV02_11740 [Acidimicrobiales bacterium]|nr:hypothetical protein [Acidimicrobiales bacterium]
MVRTTDLGKHRQRKRAAEALPSLDDIIASLRRDLYVQFPCPPDLVAEGRRLARAAAKATGRKVRSLLRGGGALYVWVDDRTDEEDERQARLLADVVQARWEGTTLTDEVATATGDLFAKAKHLGVTLAYADKRFYQDEGGGVSEDEMPSPPFPSPNSRILKALIERADKLTQEEDLGSALVWLAVHAWYEGHIEGEDHCKGCDYRGSLKKGTNREDRFPLDDRP